MTPDTNSGGIDMASDNGVIGVSVTPVSRAIGRSVTVRGVAVTGPITIAVSRVAITIAGSITIAVSWVAITISRVAIAVTVG